MQINDQNFELQDINKNTDINKDKDKDKYTENTILIINGDNNVEYCCICINTNNDNFIKLRCCNQSIHENCVIEFITNINNNIYKCPTCRKNLDVPISFGKIIDYISEKRESISKEKIQNVIINLYKDIYIKELFDIDRIAEIEHLKNTIEKLTIENDRFRVVFLFISLPLVVMITVFVFSNYTN